MCVCVCVCVCVCGCVCVCIRIVFFSEGSSVSEAGALNTTLFPGTDFQACKKALIWRRQRLRRKPVVSDYTEVSN